MTDRSKKDLELAAILAAAVAGEASNEGLAQLNDALANDPHAVSLVVDLMAQENWLSWHSDKSRYGELRPEILELISEAAQAASGKTAGLEFDNAGTITSCRTDSDAVSNAGQRCDLANSRVSNCEKLFLHSLRYASTLAAALLVTIGFLLGLVAYDPIFLRQHGTVGKLAPEVQSPDATDLFMARLVNDTACLWSLDTSPAVGANNALRAGESLNLLEGLAEVEMDWPSGEALLKIEGPAGLILTADRGASLSHGKLTADILVSGDQFALNTPNGLIEVSNSVSLGLAVAANSVELHVFRGAARVLAPWARGRQSTERVVVRQGESLRLVSDGYGSFSQQTGSASSASFASKMSMGADSLPITSDYVDTVLADQPLLYWRFEELAELRVEGAVGTHHNGHVIGEASSVRSHGNGSLQLGHRPSDKAFSSYVISDEPLHHHFDAGYSLEVWVKPSHYHWGTFVSMISPPEHPGSRSPQGLQLEVGGARAAETQLERPGRVRFLHRSPPSTKQGFGTSIFSEKVYNLRKWQHVVAVKDRTQLLLYIDGDLVSSGQDDTKLAGGMKLLVGQLDEEQFYRRFIGQIDELAFYSRPLSEAEVREHYNLVRPAWKSRSAAGSTETL